jgi:hypothetical protein
MFPTFMMKGLNSKVLTKHGKGKLEYLRASRNSIKFQESAGSVINRDDKHLQCCRCTYSSNNSNLCKTAQQ